MRLCWVTSSSTTLHALPYLYVTSLIPDIWLNNNVSKLPKSIVHLKQIQLSRNWLTKYPGKNAMILLNVFATRYLLLSLNRNARIWPQKLARMCLEKNAKTCPTKFANATTPGKSTTIRNTHRSLTDIVKQVQRDHASWATMAQKKASANHWQAN